MGATPPDRFACGGAVGDPELDVALTPPDARGRAAQRNARDDDLNGRIGAPARLESLEFVHAFEGEFAQRRDGIQSQWRAQIVEVERLAGEAVESFPQGGEVLGPDGESGGHGVPAMPQE